MDDLLGVGCRVMTIGQYLQPTAKNIPVVEYVHPDTFREYGRIGLEKGFDAVESGPLVRSSYHAERHVLVSGDGSTVDGLGTERLPGSVGCAGAVIGRDGAGESGRAGEKSGASGVCGASPGLYDREERAC